MSLLKHRFGLRLLILFFGFSGRRDKPLILQENPPPGGF
jgi:hypothetical protein